MSTADVPALAGSAKRRVSRRVFLGLGGAGAAAAVASWYAGGLVAPASPSAPPATLTDSVVTSSSPSGAGIDVARLEEFRRNVVSGGPPKDGIPPIDRPQYITAQAAAEVLRPNDVVFGVDYHGIVKAYPQRILVWHEIVNEVFAGEPVAITYCPLTGSTIGYMGRSAVDSAALTFGTSGRLVNSNLLMYDRQTDGRWPQILGVAIQGPNQGSALDEFPVVWTTWAQWQEQYPETLVLSEQTGHSRPYDLDPYGSYTEAQQGYYASSGVIFPVMAESDFLPPKTVVMGVKHGGEYLAILKEAARRERVGNMSLGGEPVVFLYDERFDTVRTFVRRLEGRELSFTYDEGQVMDMQTGSEWSVLGTGTGRSYEGAQLPSVRAWDVMWFAWYAFFPNTQVYAPAAPPGRT